MTRATFIITWLKSKCWLHNSTHSMCFFIVANIDRKMIFWWFFYCRNFTMNVVQTSNCLKTIFVLFSLLSKSSQYCHNMISIRSRFRNCHKSNCYFLSCLNALSINIHQVFRQFQNNFDHRSTICCQLQNLFNDLNLTSNKTKWFRIKLNVIW